MSKRRTLLLVLLTLAVLGVAGVARADGGKLAVAVGIAPEAFLAEKIGGDRIEVQTLVGPGQSPHTFEPTAKQMVRLGRARLLFTLGLPFEAVLAPKAAANNPGLRVVDLSQGLPRRHFGATEEHHHEADHDDHDADHDHHDADHDHHDADHDHHDADHDHHDADHDHHDADHEELDPHVWMSPRLASRIAATMAQALIQADPAGAATYQANLAALQARLDQLDQNIGQALAPLKGRDVFVFHPAFGYLLDEYGLRQVAIEFEGKAPGPKRLAQLIALAKRQNVRVIFVQPQFAQNSADALAEAIGGAVVPLDPLAHDYIDNLLAMARRIAQAQR